MFRQLLISLAMAGISTAAAAGDPFDDARYYLQIKQTQDALRIIDSGQFEVNMQTVEGYSLLHYAAEAGNLEMVKALLARGADPSLKAKTGTTAYQMATSPLVQAELRKALTLVVPNRVAPADGAEHQPTSAVPSANGMCSIVRAEPVNNGRSPTMRPFLKAKDAIWYNHPDQLIGLIEDCVGVDTQDQYGWTLLHHAADRDRVALAKILLDHGAKRTIANKDNQTAQALATSPEMKALLGAPSANPRADVNLAPENRKVDCQQKYRADVALTDDSTGKMRAMRRWSQCLKTGRYW